MFFLIGFQISLLRSTFVGAQSRETKWNLIALSGNTSTCILSLTSIQMLLLRIDKGYRRVVLDLARQFITMMDVILYYSYPERVYFSLFNDLYNTSNMPTFKGILSFFNIFFKQ